MAAYSLNGNPQDFTPWSQTYQNIFQESPDQAQANILMGTLLTEVTLPIHGAINATAARFSAVADEELPLVQQLQQQQMAGPMSADQQALKELVDEASLGGRRALSVDDAQTIKAWADEVGYRGVRASAEDVADPSNWTANPVPHFHFPGVGSGHIPVAPGLPPWN